MLKKINPNLTSQEVPAEDDVCEHLVLVDRNLEVERPIGELTLDLEVWPDDKLAVRAKDLERLNKFYSLPPQKPSLIFNCNHSIRLDYGTHVRVYHPPVIVTISAETPFV